MTEGNRIVAPNAKSTQLLRHTYTIRFKLTLQLPIYPHFRHGSSVYRPSPLPLAYPLSSRIAELRKLLPGCCRRLRRSRVSLEVDTLTWRKCTENKAQEGNCKSKGSSSSGFLLVFSCWPLVSCQDRPLARQTGSIDAPVAVCGFSGRFLLSAPCWFP